MALSQFTLLYKTDWIVPITTLSVGAQALACVYWLYKYPRYTDGGRELRAPGLTSVIINVSYFIIIFHIACVDIALTSSGEDAGGYYSKRAFYVVWQSLQYSFLAISFGPCVVLQAYELSGHYSPRQRIKHGLTRELKFYGACSMMCLAFAVVCGACTTFNWKLVKGMLLTLKNSAFCLVFVVWYAYGIQELPRRLFYRAFPKLMLNDYRIQAFNSQQYLSKLTEEMSEVQLQKLVLFKEALEARYLSIETAAPVGKGGDGSSESTVFHTVWTDAEAESLHKYICCVIVQAVSLQDSYQPQKVEGIADLVFSLASNATSAGRPDARQRFGEFTNECEKASRKCLDRKAEALCFALKLSMMRIQRELALIQQISIRYAAMEETARGVDSAASFRCGVLKPIAFITASVIAAFVAGCIVLSNLALIDAKMMAFSPLLLLFKFAERAGCVTLAVYFIYYVCSAFLIYGMMRSRIFSYFKIVSDNGTDAKSVMFASNRLPSMFFCASWNIASILRLSRQTAFFEGIGELQQIPIFGLDLMSYFPVAVAAFALFFAVRLEKAFESLFRGHNFFNAFRTKRDTVQQIGRKVIERYALSREVEVASPLEAS